MSATNRGSTRKPHDFYPTPISTIETFLDVFPLRGGIEVLEPGAGSGNIIKTLQKYGDFSIDAGGDQTRGGTTPAGSRRQCDY